MMPLLDKGFLKELDLQNERTLYAKITSLNMNEHPIESIEGKITTGSITIDGASKMRRVCSISMIAEDVDINKVYWGLHTKFKLAIGLENNINNKYDNIIWFPQGVYIIQSFKTSYTTNNYSIEISGMDKACMISGDISGSLPAENDFGKYDEIDEEGNKTTKDVLIKDIIKEAIHQYGNEMFHNIIINDLDDTGLEQLDYKYSSPIYLYYLIGEQKFTRFSIYPDRDEVYLDNVRVPLSDSRIVYGNLAHIVNDNSISKVTLEKNSDEYYIYKGSYGDAIGYRNTELTYAGDLIGKAGDAVTTILDKIVTMLGDYEYFYNLDGKFVFQKKIGYIDSGFNNIIKIEDETYLESAKNVSQISYVFSGNKNVISINNSPDFLNIKNDYSIWGKKPSLGDSNVTVPIHMRYAIDSKPTYYKAYDGKIYKTEYDISGQPEDKENELCYNGEDGEVISYSGWYDVKEWAEYYKSIFGYYPQGVIGDYCKNGSYINLEAIFPPKKDANASFTWKNYQNTLIYLFDVDENGNLGYTGHRNRCSHNYNYFLNLYDQGKKAYIYQPEIPVSDLRRLGCDWREIIYQMAIDYFNHYEEDDFEHVISKNNPEYYPTGRTGYEQYYTDMQGFWRYLYNPEPKLEENYAPEDYYLDEEDGEKMYWNKAVYEAPASLLFWIDFMNAEDSVLSKYSVKAIGARTKVINDDKIKAIYYGEIPDVVYMNAEEDRAALSDLENNSAYTRFVIPDNMREKYFTISTQSKTAQQELDQLLYENLYCKESIDITAIPIYYLDVNQRISIYDRDTDINGEYIIQKITLSLSATETMTINAIRAPKRLY